MLSGTAISSGEQRARVGQIELRNPSPLLRKVITSMGLSETLTLVP